MFQEQGSSNQSKPAGTHAIQDAALVVGPLHVVPSIVDVFLGRYGRQDLWKQLKRPAVVLARVMISTLIYKSSQVKLTEIP